MQKIIHNLKWLTLSIALGIVLGGGLITIKAWTEPTVAPPGGNIGAPINTSINPQAKIGGLQVNGFRNLGTTVLDGNVGIGTASPTLKLDVNGAIKIGNVSSLCATTIEGAIRYNTSSKRMEFCDGAKWRYFAQENIIPVVCGNGTSQTTSPGGWWPNLYHRIEISNKTYRYCNTVWGCGPWESLNAGYSESKSGQFRIVTSANQEDHKIRADFWHGEIGWQNGQWASLINGGSTSSWWGIGFNVEKTSAGSRIRATGGPWVDLNHDCQ